MRYILPVVPLLLALVACGNRGDLYLAPDEPAKAVVKQDKVEDKTPASKEE